MLTDSVDGYLARRSKSTSQFGAVLDPTMDKLFVISALCALLFEGKLTLVEMSAMLSRDFFLFLYGTIVLFTGRWKTLVFRALRWGKVTTALQFIILMGLCFDFVIPWYIYGVFMVMGILAFFELFEARKPASI
jgi:CDP-diacylglycerol--glycerol-3-phosphate 3-phosphatidyltransferase